MSVLELQARIHVENINMQGLTLIFISDGHFVKMDYRALESQNVKNQYLSYLLIGGQNLCQL